MSKKVTFKKYPSKGWDRTQIDIKVGKQKCGAIYEISRNEWAIRFQVIKDDIMEDGNKNCTWKWITLKYKGKTADEAKQWVQDNFDLIQGRYNLYFWKD